MAQRPQGPQGSQGSQGSQERASRSSAKRPPSTWQVRSDDVSMAIVVNGLVNSLTVIKAAARLLDTYWAQLPERDRTSMLADITRHADFIAGVLADVSQTLPPIPMDVIDLRLTDAPSDEEPLTEE